MLLGISLCVRVRGGSKAENLELDGNKSLEMGKHYQEEGKGRGGVRKATPRAMFPLI